MNSSDFVKVSYVKALQDNFIWMIELNKKEVVVIDPSEALPVLKILNAKNLSLSAILLTHDHWDHVGGLEELIQQYPVPIYGHCRFTSQTDKKFSLSDNVAVELIPTPGHTEKSVCYLVKDCKEQHLFCGDTLFSAGCGRVFTGDYAAMFHSLNQLKSLSNQCLIYPGHEYTLKNLAFAGYLEPDNIDIQMRLKEATQQWQTQGCTVPSTLATEKNTNPFLRCEDPALMRAVSQQVGQKVSSGLDCFIHLRQLKDSF